MLNTIRSAVAYARKAEPTAGAVAAAAAQGALMGARGNSGVILSQIMRGLKDVLAGKDELGGRDIALAFVAAKEHAYKAVTQPAPGTMLSALSEMTDAVRDGGDEPPPVLTVAARAGVGAVARTQENNPMNRAAGVVDAGARGLWLLIEGAMRRADPAAAALPPSPVSVPRQTQPAAASARPHAEAVAEGFNVADWKGAYDVQYLLVSPTRGVDELRAEMTEFGADCVLVVGDESAVKVHVHTLRPDKIIAIGMTAGRISDVVIEDLEAMAAEHERATGISVAAPSRPAPVGVVAVIPGAGLEKVARSLGATVLRGGATMNPSTEELLEAIRAANADHVIVLPNDRNVIAAAKQAASLADTKVTVIPTRSVPQGMSALVHFDAALGDAENVSAIQRASEETHGIEITNSIRECTIDGQQIRLGETIALTDGKLVAHGADEAAVLAEAARAIDAASLFTVYVGTDVAAERVRRVEAALREARPDADVEIHDGGQPHYQFLVAIE